MPSSTRKKQEGHRKTDYYGFMLSCTATERRRKKYWLRRMSSKREKISHSSLLHPLRFTIGITNQLVKKQKTSEHFFFKKAHTLSASLSSFTLWNKKRTKAPWVPLETKQESNERKRTSCSSHPCHFCYLTIRHSSPSHSLSITLIAYLLFF